MSAKKTLVLVAIAVSLCVLAISSIAIAVVNIKKTQLGDVREITKNQLQPTVIADMQTQLTQLRGVVADQQAQITKLIGAINATRTTGKYTRQVRMCGPTLQCL